MKRIFAWCSTTYHTWWSGDEDELPPTPDADELGGDATLKGEPHPPAVVTATVVLGDKNRQCDGKEK